MYLLHYYITYSLNPRLFTIFHSHNTIYLSGPYIFWIELYSKNTAHKKIFGPSELCSAQLDNNL